MRAPYCCPGTVTRSMRHIVTGSTSHDSDIVFPKTRTQSATNPFVVESLSSGAKTAYHPSNVGYTYSSSRTHFYFLLHFGGHALYRQQPYYPDIEDPAGAIEPIWKGEL